MSFLWPWALALTALAAVPVLLHLLRRDVARRVPFPALRYLEAAEREHARSIRLRDLFLLALRVCLVLAIALAAAGPLVGRGDARDHRPTDAAIVVDNSASAQRPVDGGTTLDRLLGRGREALEAAGPDDRFWVIPALGASLAAGLAAAEAAAALERVEPSDGAADLQRLVAAALAALPAAPGRAREILLLSDLQATAAAGEPPAGGRGVPLVLGREGPPPETNGAVSALELSTGGGSAPSGIPLRLTALARTLDAARGAGGAPAPDSAALRLEVDGRTAGLAMAAWGSAAVLPLPPLAPGWHAGRVEVEPSGLRADDARWFTVRVLPPPAVTRHGPAGSFVAEALATLRAAGRAGEGPRRLEVVEGVGGAGGPIAGPDGGLLIAPEDPLALPVFNQRLAGAALPWSLAAEEARGEVALREAPAVPGLGAVRVTRRYRLAVSGAAGTTDTLLRTADGEPWLVRGGARGGPVLLLLSPLVPEATTLPVNAAMIPFLEAALLRWTLPEEAAGRDAEVGEAVRLPARADSIALPDGSGRRVEGGAEFVPLRAGVYRVFSDTPDGAESASFAANVPPAESDLRPLEEAEIRGAFGALEVVDGGADLEAWRRAIYRSRRGSDAAPWLLVLAATLVVAEGLAAAPGRRRRAGERAEPAASGGGSAARGG